MNHQQKNIHTEIESGCSMFIIEDLWASNTNRLILKGGIPGFSKSDTMSNTAVFQGGSNL